MKPLAGAALGALAGYALTRLLQPKVTFKNKGVLVTGGSKGLGLLLARRFAAEGARVALLARRDAELERAGKSLYDRYGVLPLTLPCDVRDEAALTSAVAQVAATLGGLDVLVNNAGVIQVGPFENLSNEDFEDALATHLWGPLYAVRAALPFLKRSPLPRVVNVASIGGKVAVPHLSSYSASKFALVGLSDALRAELAPYGVRVTTVCPWLIRTGSHYNVQVKGDYAKEFTLFALGDSLPLVSMSAERAADRIVEACRRGQARLVLAPQGRAALLASELLPELSAAGLKLVSSLLPSPDPDGFEARRGWEVKADTPLVPSLLTRLSDRAGARNNETPQGSADAS